MKSRHALIALILLSFTTTLIHAQTTAFNYQGRLTDGGNPANGSFQMQFKLFDALAAGSQIGSTLSDVAVTATNGTFGAKLDFGSAALTGANRWLEIAVRRNSGESYVTLSPREQIASSPYAVRTLSAALADDSQKLGGVNAAEYVTNTAAGTSFIRNQAAQQPASSFNISGNGTIGGNAVINGSTGVGIAPGGDTRLTVFNNFYGIAHTNGSVTLSSFLNSSGGWLGTRTNHPLNFYTNDGNPQVTLATNGALGIGTPTPLAGYLADVAGPVRSFGNTTHFVAQTTGGTNSWARFYMRSTNRSWFIGTSQNFSGDQFYLADETAGQTRFSIQPNGGRISFLGNVGQDTGSGGLVKAMIFVNANGTIGRCYNGNTGATTGGCGFTVSHPQADLYEVNFGFDVSTRFLSMTSSSIWLPGVVAIVGRVAPGATVNSVRAVFWRSGDQTAQPSDFFLVVY